MRAMDSSARRSDAGTAEVVEAGLLEVFEVAGELGERGGESGSLVS